MIRNFCVARGTFSAANYTTVYTVPENNAFIMKFVGISSPGGPGLTTEVLMSPGPGFFNFLLATLAVPAGGTATWESWTVLNAGDQVILFPQTLAGNYWVAGAVLPYAAAPA